MSENLKSPFCTRLGSLQFRKRLRVSLGAEPRDWSSESQRSLFAAGPYRYYSVIDEGTSTCSIVQLKRPPLETSSILAEGVIKIQLWFDCGTGDGHQLCTSFGSIQRNLSNLLMGSGAVTYQVLVLVGSLTQNIRVSWCLQHYKYVPNAWNQEAQLILFAIVYYNVVTYRGP